jgi:restriction system protein
MTIAEAVATVLKQNGGPMTLESIHDAVTSQSLFQFKTDQSRQVLRAQIRRHCTNIQSRASSSTKLFEQVEDGRFKMAGV